MFIKIRNISTTMKNYILLIIALAAFMGMTSCKTNEKNYKAAYDKAVVKQRNGIDSLTIAKIEKENNAATAIVKGDSVRLITEFANMVDGKYTDVKRFNVVVAEFKQIFNARSMRDRINSIQKDAPAYVVMNNKRLYYVISHGFATAPEAADYLKNIKKRLKMEVPLEYPWIFEVPR